MILECQGVCRANMGIIFKLLCPGDVPSKAHKLILNSTMIGGYEEYCHEEYHVDIVYDVWMYDYQGMPLIDILHVSQYLPNYSDYSMMEKY